MSINRRIVERPNREEFKKMIRTTSFTQIGKQFGITPNSIKKWCDFYKLPRLKREINKISDEDWINI